MAEVKKLRDEEKLSWAAIAKAIGVTSPGTARRLYSEGGGDYHHLLPGKGGRTVEFNDGDWCDSRCIGAHPQSPCDCRCDGENHAGGPGKALTILSAKGMPADEVQEKVQHVYGIFQLNQKRFEETGEAVE